uniref:Uncharacterized protein n=1 Tax=Trypanosoma vivax (strain Y486) TaxID=1055687 RepID=G0U3E9_TRYVY|nr:hypothetical protein, unlikely [Trypanosoma vivax Y486]
MKEKEEKALSNYHSFLFFHFPSFYFRCSFSLSLSLYYLFILISRAGPLLPSQGTRMCDRLRTLKQQVSLYFIISLTFFNAQTTLPGRFKPLFPVFCPAPIYSPLNAYLYIVFRLLHLS